MTPWLAKQRRSVLPVLRLTRAAATSLGAVAMLSACFGGLNSKTAPAQRFVLQPSAAAAPVQAAPPPAGASASSSGALQVLRPAAAPGLGGDGIAVFRPGARLDFYNNARWAADAPTALQALVIEQLRAAGRFTTVEAESGPFAAEYLLSLDLTHFEARYGAGGPPTIEVTLFASLGRRSDRSVLQSMSAHSTVRAEADRMQAVIAAFEQATAEVLTQLTASLSVPGNN